MAHVHFWGSTHGSQVTVQQLLPSFFKANIIILILCCSVGSKRKNVIISENFSALLQVCLAVVWHCVLSMESYSATDRSMGHSCFFTLLSMFNQNQKRNTKMFFTSGLCSSATEWTLTHYWTICQCLYIDETAVTQANTCRASTVQTV